jgi:UDP-glucose 4-epimerase
MRALITGGAGFIGSHLADELLGRGHQAIVLDNLSTGRLENIRHLKTHPGFQFVQGDILDETLVDSLVQNCDAVFHLAAAVGVELIVKNPLHSLTTNIRGSEIIFKTASRYMKKVLITSTSEIYGKNVNAPLREDDDRILGSPLKSRWAYSTSKAVDEILAYSYWREKQLPTVIIRLFNTVGPRQTGAYGMVIPRFILQALRNEPITIYGTGKQSRCFVFVADVVQALVDVMGHPQAVGGVFNMGSQEEISMEDLARLIVEKTRSKSPLIYIPYDKAYEEGFEDMLRRVPDTSRIRDLIGFQPRHNLNQIIDKIIESYRAEPS